MGGYAIEFSSAAHRQFAKLEAEARRRIAPAIDALALDPRPPGAVALAGEESIYRIRVGAYRVVYAVEDARLVVLVVKIGHRRDVYRG